MIITKDDDGRTVANASPGELKCDFCSGPDIAWDYPASDFRDGPYGSKGGWAACEACASLIESDNRPKLAKRVAKSFMAAGLHEGVGDLAFWIREFRKLHNGFHAHRLGPRKRYQPNMTEFTTIPDGGNRG